MQFITFYGVEDIVTARVEGSSGSLWGISPPSRAQMQQELQNGSSDITVHLTWSFQRYLGHGRGGASPACTPLPALSLSCSRRDLSKGGTVENAYGKHNTDLEPGAPQRLQLAQMLGGTRNAPV